MIFCFIIEVMRSFGEYLIFSMIVLIFVSGTSQATILTPVFQDEGVVTSPNGKFMDPKSDYSRFMGRVSDKDDTGKILKIKVENNNTKFLKLVYKIDDKI